MAEPKDTIVIVPKVYDRDLAKRIGEGRSGGVAGSARGYDRDLAKRIGEGRSGGVAGSDFDGARR